MRALLPLLLSGCCITAGGAGKMRRQLEVGMDQADVLERLGQPQLVRAEGPKAIWRYTTSLVCCHSAFNVRFDENGRVEAVLPVSSRMETLH